MPNQTTQNKSTIKPRKKSQQKYIINPPKTFMSDKKFAGMAKSFENINLLTGNGSTNLSVTNRNPATTPSEFSFKVKNKKKSK